MIGLLGACGCLLVKEPLRSGWLVDGVYPQPPPPPCNPARPPGLPFDDLAAHPVPAGEAAVDLELDLPGLRGQICSGQRGPRALFARALQDAPDVIVFMSDGSAHTDHGYEDRHGGCAVYPNAFHCTVDEKTEAVDPSRLTNGQAMPPVIAISVARKDAKWMMNLAEATGGIYLDAAR